MNFRNLQKYHTPHFYGLLLDRYFPKLLRNILRRLAAFLAIIFFVLSFDSMPLYFGRADGVFFLCVAIYLILAFLEFFYRSMVNEGIRSIISQDINPNQKNLDWSLSQIIFATDEIDVTRALFESSLGQKILFRLGLNKEDAHQFVYESRVPILSSFLDLSDESVSLVGYLEKLYDADKSLQSFLATHSVNRTEFLGAVAWIGEVEEKNRRGDRFWSRENLGAIPSIGTSWSYGVVVDLGKFGQPFLTNQDLALVDVENGYRQKEVSLLEGILSRDDEANAIIIDDDEGVARDITGRFFQKMKIGVVTPNLEHKQIIELDWNSLLATFKNKSDFELELLKILREATAAMNLIIYIKDIAGFVSATKNMGIGLAALIDPFLSSRRLQFIASATNADFHFFIETNPVLFQKFERIIPDKTGLTASLPALIEQVGVFEKQHKAKFSYQAILALAQGADRFFGYGEIPGQAINLLKEIGVWADGQKIKMIGEKDVSVFVAEKTGVMIGAPVPAKEAKQIENLEAILHQRVVGQEEAVLAVANAAKKSRLLISSPKRPLASFLFFGPTGVGKTETAKALAESFFGDENKMIRFDMSEYSGANGLVQLTGDFASNKSGALANKIKDHPYGVLLLDEFEKAAPDVLDLFLQVLDEGVFTDALQRQINCRNLIIVATSNAGSDLIWQMVKNKKDLNVAKDSIVEQIVEQKIFRLELLNRFDGLILFKPLDETELSSIAKLELQKLADRMKESDIRVVFARDVIPFLVKEGQDAKFGGRSMNRIIKDRVENFLANQIIAGIKSGAEIVIKADDLRLK